MNNDLKNETGIFLVSIYRSIFMKLLYNEKREIIDENMSGYWEPSALWCISVYILGKAIL